MKSIPKELLTSLNAPTIKALSDIERVRMIKHVDDACGVIESGGVLLAVAINKNEDDGDPFYCLVGLPRGIELTPYLKNFF